jgi:hypothetical protein
MDERLRRAIRIHNVLRHGNLHSLRRRLAVSSWPRSTCAVCLNAGGQRPLTLTRAANAEVPFSGGGRRDVWRDTPAWR